MASIQYLPYLGKKPDAPVLTTEDISFADLHEHYIDEDADPCAVLIAKVTRLARALKVTEAQAEAILFERI